jgi:lysophospholipase
LTGEEGEGRVETRDGLSLYAPSAAPVGPRAAVVLVHGLFEHCARYHHVARYLVDRGLACQLFDHRGHGRSPGPRVHVSTFDEFLWDVDAAVDAARRRWPALPLFLLGHSHGALVSLLWTLRHGEALAGLALSSPFLGVPPAARPGRLLALAARVLSVVLPGLRLDSGVDSGGVSRDPRVVAAYRADPLIGGKLSSRWYTEALAAFAAAQRGAALLRTPTLLMAAGRDRIADVEATRRLAAAIPPDLLQTVWWDELYHEIFNEPEKEAVLARLGDWLESRLAR